MAVQRYDWCHVDPISETLFFNKCLYMGDNKETGQRRLYKRNPLSEANAATQSVK